MSMPATLALQIVVMFMLVGVGFAMFRAGKITMEGNRTIGNILVYLSLPCVIIKGLMVERTAENVAALGVSALMGFVALLVSALVARLVLRGDAIGNFSATFSNPSFFGIPLVVSILGQEPVFYMTAYIAFMNLGQWTYGVSLLAGERGRVSLRSLVRSPFMVATLIGLVLFATQLQLPGVVTSCLDYVSALNTPLVMFAIGVYLAQSHPADRGCGGELGPKEFKEAIAWHTARSREGAPSRHSSGSTIAMLTQLPSWGIPTGGRSGAGGGNTRGPAWCLSGSPSPTRHAPTR